MLRVRVPSLAPCLIYINVRASDLFSLPKSFPFKDYFLADSYPWEWIGKIGGALEGFDFMGGHSLIPSGLMIEGNVYIHPTVKLPPYGYIQGPAYIGAGTELRVGVYIRGNVIVGEGCVLGNACEYKNCLLMDGVQTPHFNYVGDSVLGNGVHLAAGVILANLRLDKKLIRVDTGVEKVQTNYRKLGAMIGDGAEIGCNAVLQPGTIVGKRAFIGPCCAVGGYVAEGVRV